MIRDFNTKFKIIHMLPHHHQTLAPGIQRASSSMCHEKLIFLSYWLITIPNVLTKKCSVETYSLAFTVVDWKTFLYRLLLSLSETFSPLLHSNTNFFVGSVVGSSGGTSSMPSHYVQYKLVQHKCCHHIIVEIHTSFHNILKESILLPILSYCCNLGYFLSCSGY